MPFGLVATFSEEALVERLNAELANDLGNLAARATTLIVNLRRGEVPSPGPPGLATEALRGAMVSAQHEVREAMGEFAFQRALRALWGAIGQVNRYIDTTEPWRLAKEKGQGEQLDRVLYDLGEALRILGILLAPFVPDAAGKIRRAVGETGEPGLAEAAWGRLKPGTRVERLSGLFPRIDGRKRVESRAAPDSPRRATQPGPTSPRLSIDEFRRLDLRVATILTAEPVPKSKKLLKLTVELGDETRTVVAGIAEHYTPEALRGMRVVVVANLEPVTLMGVTSNGMVLAGSEGDTLALLTLDRDLPPGARVR